MRKEQAMGSILWMLNVTDGTTVGCDYAYWLSADKESVSYDHHAESWAVGSGTKKGLLLEEALVIAFERALAREKQSHSETMARLLEAEATLERVAASTADIRTALDEYEVKK